MPKTTNKAVPNRKVILSSTFFYLLLSVLFLSQTSCSTQPKYTRRSIERVIDTTCRQEFGLDVTVSVKGDTVWIYAPLSFYDDMGNYKINAEGKIDESLIKDIRRIAMSMSKVFLDMDDPPKFYCVVYSSIEKSGLDIYKVVFLPDEKRAMIISQTSPDGYIPTKEMDERTLTFQIKSLAALDDKKGKHIFFYDIEIKEFVGLLIQKTIIQEFFKEELIDSIEFNDISIQYAKNEIILNYDIQLKSYKKGLPVPAKKIEEITKHFLDIYASFSDLKRVRIHDLFSIETKIVVVPKNKINQNPTKISQSTSIYRLTKLYANAFYHFKGNSYFDNKTENLKKAKTYFEKAAEIMPTDTFSLVMLGSVYSDTGQNEKAITFLKKALEILPDNPTIHSVLGTVYSRLEKFELAIYHLQEALRLEPELTEIDFNLAATYFMMKDYNSAIKHLQKVIKVFPKNVKAYGLLGANYTQLKEYSLATSYYQKALDLEPNNPEILAAIGEIDQQQGNAQNAITRFHQLLEKNPDSFTANFKLGQLYAASGKHQIAIDHYEKALKIQPESLDVLFNIAATYLDAGRSSNNETYKVAAVNSFQKALLLSPENPDIYRLLGESYISLKQFDKAIINLETAIVYSPKMAEAYYSLGYCYYYLNNYKEAYPILQDAMYLFYQQGNDQAAQKAQDLLNAVGIDKIKGQ